MTPFQGKVYQAVGRIPRGQVATYADIARAVGHPGAARAVGQALRRNPHIPKTPCHRIIGSDGKIGGYVFGVKKKIEMLKKEGILIERGKIVWC